VRPDEPHPEPPGLSRRGRGGAEHGHVGGELREDVAPVGVQSLDAADVELDLPPARVELRELIEPPGRVARRALMKSRMTYIE
jgi:hypothetical protein